jgi:3-dehydroquinate synthase
VSEPLVVPVGQDYSVLVGRSLHHRLPGLVPEGAERVAVLHAPGIQPLVEPILAALRPDRQVLPIELPDGEAAKTATVCSQVWARLGAAGFTRTDVIVGIGGGATTDLAGFVAATWLRGVPVVQIPTTLLGMVDAAVGGKTGINTAEGKNLVGAFHPPVAVVCDLDVLRTLPGPDLTAGLAEVAKHGFIADERTLALLESDPRAATDPSGPVLLELVERSVQVKASVVAADLKESFLREILNYGHTFGHAIEQVEAYRRRHGEAVAVGLVYAAELSHLAGRLPVADVARHRSVLSGIGLPTTYPAGRWPALHAAMARDKKNRGSRLRFVVLDGIGRPGRLENPSEELLQAAYGAVSGA